MILEVYDKDTNNRVDIIRTFTFVQYTEYFNDVGTFTVKVPINEKSLPNLMKIGNYILFEPEVMGIIKYHHKESIETAYVEVKGYLINHVLTYRSFLRTTRYSGKLFTVQRKFIKNLFMTNDDSRRNIDLITLEEEYPDSETVDFINTGDTAAEQLRYTNLQYGYGYKLVPILQKYDEQSDRPTNIKNFEFRSLVPENHSIFNQEGNTPVIFSTNMNNLSELIYENDLTEFCNIAIVAGEDIGENRKLAETGDTLASGINRMELYVDARDLQSGNHDPVYSDEVYFKDETYTKEEVDELVEGGVSPTANVEQLSDGARITITDKSGTTTARVYNGTDGVDGADGKDGEDGYSPYARVDQGVGSAIITVRDKNGTTTATVYDGAQGPQGPQGDDYILTSQDKQDIATIVVQMIGSADTMQF